MYTWIISCILFHVYNSKFWSFPPISRISIFARFLHFFVFQAPSLPPQPDASVKRGHIQKLTIFVWFFRPEPPQVLSSGQVEHCSGNVFFYVLFAFSGECETLGKLPTLGPPNNYSYEIRLIVGGAGGVRPMNESCLMSGRVMWYMLMSHVIHANESCHMWYMLMSHVIHANESCHMCEWVISRMWIIHITHKNQSYHICGSHRSCHTYDTHRSCHTCHVTGDICEWVMSSLFHRHVRIDPVERNVVTCVCVCVCMCVWERASERGGGRERTRERPLMFMCVCMGKRQCAHARARAKERMCVYKKEKERENEKENEGARVSVSGRREGERRR